jgi:hypothetical protein
VPIKPAPLDPLNIQKKEEEKKIIPTVPQIPKLPQISPGKG